MIKTNKRPCSQPQWDHFFCKSTKSKAKTPSSAKEKGSNDPSRAMLPNLLLTNKLKKLPFVLGQA
jgi:hypothetical protein